MRWVKLAHGRALEALLAESAKALFETSNAMQDRYNRLTKTLSESQTIPTASLQEMLELKDAGEEFKRNADDFRSAIRDLLQEEGDMASMYLTDQAAGKARKVGDDDQIELLLEMQVCANSLQTYTANAHCRYRHHAYSLTDVAATLLTRLNSITNHVTLLLSSTRNRLLNMVRGHDGCTLPR